MNNMCPYNTFIFNWVKNNEKQIERIKESMKKFNNIVKVFNHLNHKQLAKEVYRLTLLSNFSPYDYISIIILDNTSKSEQFIKTSDGIDVLVYSEILTIIQTNETLKDKRRLFVIQKLFDFSDFDDEDEEMESTKIVERSRRFSLHPWYRNRKTLYQGLTIGIKAKEFSNDFKNSPFIETFCKEFESNAGVQPIDQIYYSIVNDIKTNYGPKKIDISFETNQTSNDSLIFGLALTKDEHRDFIE